MKIDSIPRGIEPLSKGAEGNYFLRRRMMPTPTMAAMAAAEIIVVGSGTNGILGISTKANELLVVPIRARMDRRASFDLEYIFVSIFNCFTSHPK